MMPAAPHTTPPNNHGKKWSPSEDEHITNAPALADSHFAQLLRRSEQAVASRRAVLAAKLHRSSGRPLAECAATLHADARRTALALSNRHDDAKRTTTHQADSKPGQPATTTAGRAKPPQPCAPPHGRRDHHAIARICDHVKRTNGDIDGIWAQDDLAPTLIQFYAGVQAYATFVAKF